MEAAGLAGTPMGRQGVSSPINVAGGLEIDMKGEKARVEMQDTYCNFASFYIANY